MTEDDLCAKYLPLARSLARRNPYGLDRDEAESAACLGLFQAVRRYDPKRGALTTMIYLLVQCRLLDARRRKKRNSAVGHLEYDPPARAERPLWEQREAFEVALQRAPENRRALLRLLYWDGLRRSEVAERLGISHQRVSQLVCDAKKAVRR